MTKRGKEIYDHLSDMNNVFDFKTVDLEELN
jgi:hypothetical protein